MSAETKTNGYKLYVGKIEEGFVIDHIHAGRGMKIYRDLGLDRLECSVAIILNASSKKMGKKDMIKVECPIDQFDMDFFGFLDPSATVDVIKDGKIISKPKLKLPEKLINVVRCHNPRCITSGEPQLDQIFVLTDPLRGTYRCQYCETAYKNED